MKNNTNANISKNLYTFQQRNTNAGYSGKKASTEHNLAIRHLYIFDKAESCSQTNMNSDSTNTVIVCLMAEIKKLMKSEVELRSINARQQETILKLNHEAQNTAPSKKRKKISSTTDQVYSPPTKTPRKDLPGNCILLLRESFKTQPNPTQEQVAELHKKCQELAPEGGVSCTQVELYFRSKRSHVRCDVEQKRQKMRQLDVGAATTAPPTLEKTKVDSISTNNHNHANQTEIN